MAEEIGRNWFNPWCVQRKITSMIYLKGSTSASNMLALHTRTRLELSVSVERSVW